MKKLLLSSILLSFFFYQLQAQCPPGRYLNKTFSVDTIKNVVYGSNTPASGTGTTNLIMDIYRPAGDTFSFRPVVIFAHGGSFVAGDRQTSDMIKICAGLAARGYVCASIEYRLENALAFVAPNANELMVKEVVRAAQDGKAAVRFFRKDAATTNTYKIDPTQIFFGGTSAGGILALHLAYMQETDPLPGTWVTWANAIGGFEGTSGNAGYPSNVKAVVSYAGGIGDTNWMNETNIPWTDFHSVNDGTVPDSTGYPLGLSTLPLLHGGRMMNRHGNSTGVYHEYWQFPGNNHPPFADGLASTWDTIENRTVRFLYKNLECNPDHIILKINDYNFNSASALSIYPIPTSDFLNIESINNELINQITIIDIQGNVVFSSNVNQQISQQVAVKDFTNGIYFIKIQMADKTYTAKFIKE